jgi:SAM-dependent methyltransferase
MAEHDLWAPWYDLIQTGLPGEAEFYVYEAALRRVPTLELGCGTGRIAIPMAMSGVDVTGLDNSPAMLELCAEKLACVAPVKGRLRLAEADMRAFRLRRKFGLIVMPYRAFMHCLTPDEQLACLHCVREHLAEGGECILNVWAATPGALGPLRGQARGGRLRKMGTHTATRGRATLTHYADTWRDDHTQLLHETHRVVEKSAGGRVRLDERMTLTRAWITPREMAHLAARAGFRVRAVHGSFDGEPFGPESTEMIWRLEA